MPDYEKPKRHLEPDNEFYLILRHFYWRLFCYLMTPALILGFIFCLPIAFLNNQPDRLNAQCSTYSDGLAVRIISETRRMNTTTYYWSDNNGATWHIVYTEELPYQMANAACGQVEFNDQSISIQTATGNLYVLPDGEVSQ